MKAREQPLERRPEEGYAVWKNGRAGDAYFGQGPGGSVISSSGEHL